MNDTNAPASADFDDDEDVAFDQTPVVRSPESGAPAEAESDPDEEDFELVELPKPCGLRDATVTEIKVLPKKGDEPLTLSIAVQIADVDFPADKNTNPPISLRVKQTEVTKLKAIAKVLGIDAKDFTSKAGRAKGVGVHCRVFATVYRDQMQIPNFAPSLAKRNENKAFFAHVDALGIDDKSYNKDYAYNDFCGFLPAT